MSGIDDLSLSLSQIAELPTDIQDEMLNVQADIGVKAQQEKARSYGVVRSGLTASSIRKTKTKIGKDGRCIYVYPQGSRKRGKTVTRNAEIAFIAEYGRRKQKARPFIRAANEACAEQTTAAAASIYDRWLKSKNL